MAIPLPNYLRTYRKCAGLTQDEMAYLLGCQSGTKISRYEQYARKPNLETVLACQVIFHIPTETLFLGTYRKVEEKTRRRVLLLIRRLDKQSKNPMTARKLEHLRKIFLSQDS